MRKCTYVEGTKHIKRILGAYDLIETSVSPGLVEQTLPLLLGFILPTMSGLGSINVARLTFAKLTVYKDSVRKS
jgi:hypothetical protein